MLAIFCILLFIVLLIYAVSDATGPLFLLLFVAFAVMAVLGVG